MALTKVANEFIDIGSVSSALVGDGSVGTLRDYVDAKISNNTYYSSPIYAHTGSTTAEENYISVTADNSGNVYWAVVESRTGSTYSFDSHVYKRDINGVVTTYATVNQAGACGTSLIYNPVDGALYWAIASYYNGASYVLASTVYRIMSSTTKNLYATVTPTSGHGAIRTSLAIGASGEIYWSLTSHYNGATYTNARSFIYKLVFVSNGALATRTVYVEKVGTGFIGDALVVVGTDLYWAQGMYTDGTTKIGTTIITKITSASTWTTPGSAPVYASVATKGCWSLAMSYNAVDNNLHLMPGNFADDVPNGVQNNNAYIIPVTAGASAAASPIFNYRTTNLASVASVVDADGVVYWCYCTLTSLIAICIYKTVNGVTTQIGSIHPPEYRSVALALDADNNLIIATVSRYGAGKVYGIFSQSKLSGV